LFAGHGAPYSLHTVGINPRVKLGARYADVPLSDVGSIYMPAAVDVQNDALYRAALARMARARDAKALPPGWGELDGSAVLGAWGEVFGDLVIASAVLDRLLHHSITVNIKSESFRLKEKLKAGLLKPKIGEPPVTT
jgi:hypothetical protein